MAYYWQEGGVTYCWLEETQKVKAAGIPLWLPAPVLLSLGLCLSHVTGLSVVELPS